MSFYRDLRILYHLVLRPVRGGSHAERMESFYAGQAEDYDEFRKRLLHGREQLYRRISVAPGMTWIDLGGGTGSNLEFVADRIGVLKSATVVDLSPSLLKMAERRIEANGWSNVQAVQADATTWQPEGGQVDIVTMSYSLTMIPDWFLAIDNALRMLRPGGTLGVVDFYVARKHVADGLRAHGWLTRSFWPVWFASDNVFPSPDHLPYLRAHLQTEWLEESRSKVPFLPLLRVPYYQFIGRKAERHREGD